MVFTAMILLLIDCRDSLFTSKSLLRKDPMRDLRRHAVIVIMIGLIGFSTLARRPRFQDIHNVDILQLLASGACFGIGLTLLLSRRQPKV